MTRPLGLGARGLRLSPPRPVATALPPPATAPRLVTELGEPIASELGDRLATESA